MIHDVLAGGLDLAIATEPPEAKRLTTVKIAESPFYIAMSKDDELAGESDLSLDALAGRQWVLFERRMHPQVYDFLNLAVVSPASIPAARSWRRHQLADVALAGLEFLQQAPHLPSPLYEPREFSLITDCRCLDGAVPRPCSRPLKALTGSASLPPGHGCSPANRSPPEKEKQKNVGYDSYTESDGNWGQSQGLYWGGRLGCAAGACSESWRGADITLPIY